MPGILVGIDGSAHSRHALEWAVGEAANRRAPLTVLIVNQPVAGFWGSTVPCPGDPGSAKQGLVIAQQETDSVLSRLRLRLAVFVATEPPSVDGHEITDKGYVNQRAALERRHALVDKLYQNPPPPEVIEIQ